MIDQLVWGLVQGLTEFLPVSSSGHLVLVPAFLGMDEPGIATTAVLHLGTLLAVLVYYRRDLAHMLRFRTDPSARRLVTLLIIGTVPAAALGLAFESSLEDLFTAPRPVGLALIATGLILVASGRLTRRHRTVPDAKVPDAVLVGTAQALALVPGISRSGITITASLARGLTDVEAARFSFLLAIPAIAGAGLLEFIRLLDEGGLGPEMAVGLVAATVSGYVAIAFLLRIITRFGLAPFSVYCFLVGAAALIRF